MRKMRWIVPYALLWAVAILMLNASMSHAQKGGWVESGRSESTPDARYKRMWNATGSTIADGTLVMVDTVAAGTTAQIALGKGFRTWDALAVGAATSNVYRIVGLTVGDIPSYSPGKILVEGTHNNALMDATAITGMTRLRPSLTTAGALASWAITDSTNLQKKAVGIFQRYATTSTLRGYVYVNFSGQVFGK